MAEPHVHAEKPIRNLYKGYNNQAVYDEIKD